MNAHSVLSRDLRDCNPTKEDYDRFRTMAFLHNRAPLFALSDESQAIAVPVRHAVIPTPAVERQQVLPSEPLTTPKVNNVATPFLRTPDVAVRSPQSRAVTIMELLAIEVPEKVRIGNLEIQVVINPQKGPVFKTSSGQRFYVSQFEVRCLTNPPTRRFSKETLAPFVSLHRDLRGRFIDQLTRSAIPFQASAAFLDSLVAGQYVKVSRGRKSTFFMVTGDKREKRLEYVTALRSGPRVRFGTSIKIRRIQNGAPTGSSDEDNLLEYFQRLYA